MEGRGCAVAVCEGPCTSAACPGGRRPGLVYLATRVPVASASATIPGASVPVAVDILARSADGLRTALAVRVPVSAALPDDLRPLDLTVVGTDGSVASKDDEGGPLLMLFALDELVLGGPLTGADRIFHSSIVVPEAFVAELTGPRPVELIALSDILMGGILSADATASAPGPGGCPGVASASEPPSCPFGSGGSSTIASGGGGGFGTAGAGGALGGEVTGTPMLLSTAADPSVATDDNRGHGGGAHGDRPGGHGGGSVTLLTEGKLVMGQFARVTARGGAPAAAEGLTGGGGSGGAIIIGANAGLVIEEAAPLPFEATGGGDPDVRGGDGRIRIDSPDDLGSFERATPRPWQGPAWIDVPLVVGAEAELELRIDPRWTEPLVVVHWPSDEVHRCVPSDGRCRVRVPMVLGRNGLCVKLRDELPVGMANGPCVAVVRVD